MLYMCSGWCNNWVIFHCVPHHVFAFKCIGWYILAHAFCSSLVSKPAILSRSFSCTSYSVLLWREYKGFIKNVHKGKSCGLSSGDLGDHNRFEIRPPVKHKLWITQRGAESVSRSRGLRLFFKLLYMTCRASGKRVLYPWLRLSTALLMYSRVLWVIMPCRMKRKKTPLLKSFCHRVTTQLQLINYYYYYYYYYYY